MQKDERDLLEVLKFELEFLEDGGYGRSPRTPWRPQASGRRTGSGSTSSQQTATLRRRNGERNSSVPKAASKVCKPGLSDCLSLDRGRQVLPGFGPIRFQPMGLIQQLIRWAEFTGSDIIGSVSVAHMSSRWCTTKNTALRSS